MVVLLQGACLVYSIFFNKIVFSICLGTNKTRLEKEIHNYVTIDLPHNIKHTWLAQGKDVPGVWNERPCAHSMGSLLIENFLVDP